LMFWKRFWFG